MDDSDSQPPAPGGAGYWFTPVPVYLTDACFNPASPVNGSAVMLWAHLHRNYAWRRRMFPSYATLAKETEQSQSAVKRQLIALREAGALDWSAGYGQRGRTSNDYALAPVRPFEFDRDLGSAVEVKNELHRPVEVKNDLGVEVKSDRHPQFKNDPVVEEHRVSEDSLSSRLPHQTRDSPAAPGDERDSDTTKIYDAWVAARGRPGSSSTETKIRNSASSLLNRGWQLADVIALAEDMARHDPRFTDLSQHEPFWQPAPATTVVETCDRCRDSKPHPGWVEEWNPTTHTERLVRCDHQPAAA